MNSDAHLILTVDYELFGDGSGCLDVCVLQPAERMLQIAARFDAPVTFFAEALEFIALSNEQGDDRATVQLQKALAYGHDVQLHLHPQWAGACFDIDRGWQVDMARWRIGDLPAEEVEGLIRQGKQWLKVEVAANVPGYRCLAFRAGGWCIQPSAHVIQALRREGFMVDSTVAPGQWRPGCGEWSDFRAAPDLPFWKTQEDVCIPDPQGLWEVPIAAGSIGRLRHLRSLTAARKQADGGMAPTCTGSYRGPANGIFHRLWMKSARLAQLGRVMLDLSTLPAQDLIDVTRQWLARYGETNGMPIPIVAIAHTKNFSRASEEAMGRYLSWASDVGIRFSTYGQWLDAMVMWRRRVDEP